MRTTPRKRLVIAFTIIAAGCAASLMSTPVRWQVQSIVRGQSMWWRQMPATIRVHGTPEPDARAYRSTEGDIAVVLPRGRDRVWIVTPSRRSLYDPNMARFLFAGPWALSSVSPSGWVGGMVKTGLDRPIVGAHAIRFAVYERGPVAVSF